MKYYLLFFLLFPMAVFAQVRINGRVINEIDNTPISAASVFLNNATVGNKTDDEGKYKLTNVKPGQYELIVTVVGYESHRQTILAAADDTTLADIKLLPKTTLLNEVKIIPNFNREKYYNEFKLEFLGRSEYASQTYIVNPDAVDIEYDPATKVLTASTAEYLEIENKALGYKIKYYLTKFEKDSKKGRIFYKGEVLYEALEGTPSQQRRWAKKRNSVYTASSMQFLRTVLAKQVDQFFIVGENFDTQTHARMINFQPKDTLNISDYAHITDQKGIYAIGYKSPLYVWYSPVRYGKNDVQPERDRPILTGKLTLLDKNAFFDTNGTILNPEAALFDYRWGYSRVAEQLPVDFEPEVEKP